MTSAAHFVDRAYHRFLSRKSFSRFHTLLYAKNIAKTIDVQLRARPCDVLFASQGSSEIAFLETSIPIVYQSDATFQLVLDYYKAFTNLPKRNISQGNEIEKRALEKASHVILLSNWANLGPSRT